MCIMLSAGAQPRPQAEARHEQRLLGVGCSALILIEAPSSAYYTDWHGNVREIEVTVFGWKAIVLIDALTKIPLAVKVVPIHEHEVLSMRALVTQARTNLAGDARPHKVVFDRGLLNGVEWWWLDHHGITFVVPAKDNMAVTVDARAQAAVGEAVTVRRRVHTMRHGHGKS